MPEDRAEPPARSLRWWILVMLFLAITINMLDRQVLSIVAPILRDQFHLSNTDYGAILFCFLLGMTLGQIPVGQMLDRRGARWGFSFIIIGWSIANVCHSLARSAVQFSGLRLLLGLNECGTYSGGTKVIGQWFPIRERALASGIFNSGSLAGAIIAPPLIVWLVDRHGWRAAFLIPGAVGLLWILPWLLLYWEPARHPRLTPRERTALAGTAAVAAAAGAAVRVRDLLRVRAVWGMILMRALGGPVTHFYWYWLPEYLKRARGMSFDLIGMLAWLPFLFGALGNVGGGGLSSLLLRRGWSVDAARKTPVVLGAALCVLAVLVPGARTSAAAIALICAATFGINAIAANQIGILTDLFPEAVLARVGALTGVGDGIVSMILMLATGYVVDRFSYTPIFAAAGILPVLVLLSLLLIVGRIRPVSLPSWSSTSTPTIP